MKNNCGISVRGLRTETKINDIFEIFQEFGTITSCRLITDKRNESKGYCFISYSKPDEANLATFTMNGKRFDGAILNIVDAAVQNEIKFDDPELRGVKIPPSHPEGRGPPSENNWERHFKYTGLSSSSSYDEDTKYYNSSQNIPDVRDYNMPQLPRPSPPQLPSTKVSQPPIPAFPHIPPPPPPPPPEFLQQQQKSAPGPPLPPPLPPPPSLISQQNRILPPPPLSQQQQMPMRSNYQPPPPPPPSHSPSPSPSQSSNSSRQHIQYQPPNQPPNRHPYRSRDYNNYGPPENYSFEQDFQREYQFRSSGGNPRMEEPSRYQYYPPPESRYPPPESRYPMHSGQRPPPGNYGRPPPGNYERPPPPPPSHRPPPPMQPRYNQGHRQDRPPPSHMPPPPNQQHDMYFESD